MKKAVKRILSKLPANYTAILMFHHVAETDRRRIRENDHLKVSPEFLDGLLAEFKGRGFAFLSMDEVADNVSRARRCGRAVALTFDDGYADNFTVGFDVLRSHGAPATVYVATGLASGEAPMWWDALEDWLLANAEVTLPNGERRDVRSPEEKGRTFLELRDWVFSLPTDRVAGEVARLCCSDAGIWRRLARGAASFEVLRRFSHDRLLSIGCHTHRHIPCGYLKDDEVMDDVARSLDLLRTAGVEPRHFAFPYGDDIRDANRLRGFLRSCGFQTAVTTEPGLITPRGADPYFLPRYFVTEYENGPYAEAFDCQYFKGLIRGSGRKGAA